MVIGPPEACILLFKTRIFTIPTLKILEKYFSRPRSSFENTIGSDTAAPVSSIAQKLFVSTVRWPLRNYLDICRSVGVQLFDSWRILSAMIPIKLIANHKWHYDLSTTYDDVLWLHKIFWIVTQGIQLYPGYTLLHYVHETIVNLLIVNDHCPTKLWMVLQFGVGASNIAPMQCQQRHFVVAAPLKCLCRPLINKTPQTVPCKLISIS